MGKLTVLIPTFNEEDRLRDCLTSIQWADEILVVDSFSTDKTLDIAQEFGAKIVQHDYQSHASQLNWAIPQCRNEWILLLDADERVSDRLRNSIQESLQNIPDRFTYFVKRTNLFFGHELRHGGWGRDWIIRFFHRDHGRIQEYGYHGDIITDSPSGTLHGEIIHLTYRTLDDYFRKFHLYTDEGARLLFQKKRRASWVDLFLRPFWRFFFSYIIRLGFLDGIPGLIVSMLSTFYSFTKYLKLWYMQFGKDR